MYYIQDIVLIIWICLTSLSFHLEENIALVDTSQPWWSYVCIIHINSADYEEHSIFIYYVWW